MFIKETFDVRKQYVIIDLQSGGVCPFPACRQKIALNIEQPWDFVEEAKVGRKNYKAKFFDSLENACSVFGANKDVLISLRNVRYGAAPNSTFGGTLPTVLTLNGINFGWCDYVGAYTPTNHVGDIQAAGHELMFLGMCLDVTRKEYGDDIETFKLITPTCDIDVKPTAPATTGVPLCVLTVGDELYLGELEHSPLSQQRKPDELKDVLNADLVNVPARVVALFASAFLGYPEEESPGVYTIHLLERRSSIALLKTGYSWQVHVVNQVIVKTLPLYEGKDKMTSQVLDHIAHLMALMGLAEHKHGKRTPMSAGGGVVDAPSSALH